MYNTKSQAFSQLDKIIKGTDRFSNSTGRLIFLTGVGRQGGGFDSHARGELRERVTRRTGKLKWSWTTRDHDRAALTWKPLFGGLFHFKPSLLVACWYIAASNVCDGTSAVGESRHRIPGASVG